MAKETFIHREQGFKWELPKYLRFFDNVHFKFPRTYDDVRNAFTYNILGYRAPKKGEWYLSGAVCTAYYAPNDLTTKFLVVEPTQMYKPVQTINWFPV